jgi:ribosomal 50S subunit-recycling heat shock protein
MTDEAIEKVRVSKLMAAQGLCSRREADSYIERGWVRVDGEVVKELGTRIFAHQTITLSGAAQAMQQQRVTVLLNNNSLTSLPNALFASLPQLTRLDLSVNSLSLLFCCSTCSFRFNCSLN